MGAKASAISDAGACEGLWCPAPPDDGGERPKPCGEDDPSLCNDGGTGGSEFPDAGPLEVNVTAQVFGARGEYTSPSFLTAAPPGAALRARNVMVDVPGEYTTARGFERLPAALPGGVKVDSWTVYQGAPIVHSGATLYRYVSGTWTAYAGTYYAPEGADDAGGDPLPGKVRFFSTQQALYFTTSAGVYRLEGLTESPTIAGVPQGLIGTASVASAGQALSVSSVTAYRYVWGRRATNGRIHLGAPSGRIEVTNASESITFNPSAVVKTGGVVTVTVTSGVASNLLVGQVVTLSTVDAADEPNFPEESEIITSITVGTPSFFTYAQSGANATAASPTVITMTSTATAVDVSHVIPFPEGLDDSHFLQVYRSDEVPLNVTPSDEMYLVHEKPVAEMAGGATSYTFTDSTPDALKADALYTNANAGGGIGSAHFSPPQAATSAVFQNRAFFGAVELPERLTLTALSVEQGGLTEDSGISVSDGTTTLLYYGDTIEQTGLSFGGYFKVYTDGTPAQNIANTVRSLVRVMNSTPGGLVYGRYLSTDSGLPGQFQIESRLSSSARLVVRALRPSPYIMPALGYETVALSMVRNLDVSTVTTMQPHGFVIGQVVRREARAGVSVDPNFPEGDVTIATVPSSTSFTFEDVGVNASSGDYQFVTIGQDVTTDDEAAPGGWMVSDVANPDSVPATIPEIAGDRYKRLLRFLVLNGSLFMLKEDGLFRLTGSDPTTFVVEHVDSTIRFVAPDMAVVIGSTAYALTTEGLVSWTESTSPVPASVPVEDQFRNLVETARDAVDSYAFAVAHDSKRRVWFFLPSSAEDTSATKALVLNTLTNTWVTRLKPAVAAMVHPDTDRFFLAPPETEGTGLTPAPSMERNSGTNADYQEEDGEAVEAEIQWTPQFGPGPNVMKQLVWGYWHFQGALPSTITVGFATDLVPTPVFFPLNSTHTQQPGTLGTPPTIEHSRGNYHILTLRHGVAQEPLRLLGYSARLRWWETR